MKFYLSSYGLGNEENLKKFQGMIACTTKVTAYISNALDICTDPERKKEYENEDMSALKAIGLIPNIIDLRDYFGQQAQLKQLLEKFDIIWVSGGNTFVLRQAMKLSGLDDILQEYYKQNKEIIYGGYSAGICILAPTLKGLDIVDNPNLRPYGDHATIWDGLGIIDYSISPHYQSNHPESNDIEKEVQYMIENKLPFKTLKDGEVIILP